MKFGALPVLFIGLGGALGSVCRYLLGGATQRLTGGTFPLGTLAVNLIGCCAIGFLNVKLVDWLVQPQYRLGITVGFLGGLTTFSTFSWETLEMINDGEIVRPLLNVGLTVLLSIAGVWLGYHLAGRGTTL